MNRHISNNQYLKFILPSLLGLIFFLLPVNYAGKWTIPMGVLSDSVKAQLIDVMPIIILIIASLSVLGSLAHKRRSKENDLSGAWRVVAGAFDVSTIWLLLRALGAVVAFCIFFEWGPEWLWGDKTGSVVMYDLLVPSVTIFLFAGFLLPLLTDYGLMEFVGNMLRRPFKFLFGLPGRAGMDCIASWMSAAVVGIMLTSQQYERGYYSGREAAVISTNFSIVSVPWCLVIAQFVGLDHMFLQFYLTVFIAGMIAAMIVPRLPPLSNIADTYSASGKQVPAQEDAEQSALRRSMNAALTRASKSPGFAGWFKSGVGNVADIWFGLFPPAMLIATLGLVVTEYTPIMAWLAVPWVPVLELLHIPHAQEASPALVLGFAEMFLPAALVSGIDSELTRFVIAATSIVQLIYMSEVGVFILKSNIPLNFGHLVVIFIIRTLVTLPVIAAVAHFLIF